MNMAIDQDTPVFFLTKEMKDQFTKTRDLLDSILETFEILEDTETMKRLQEAEVDIKEQKIVSLEDLKKEL